MWPNITRGNEATKGTDPRVSQIMDMMENCLTKRLRDKRPEMTGRNVAMERKTKNLVLGMVQ